MPPIKKIKREQVRAARGWLGWQIRELAEKAGVAVYTISKFENGLADASLETLFKLQDAFSAAGVEFPDEHTVTVRRTETPDQS